MTRANSRLSWLTGIVAAIVLTLGATASQAGTQIDIQARDLESEATGDPVNLHLQVDNGWVSIGSAKYPVILAYDASRDALMLFNHSRQVVLTMTGADHSEQIAQIQELIARYLAPDLSDRKTTLSDELVGKILAKYGPKISGSGRVGVKQVNGVQCDEHHVMLDGTPVESVCVASERDLGLESPDLATLKKFVERVWGYLASHPIPSVLGHSLPKLSPVSPGGFPIRVTPLRGTGKHRWLVTGFEQGEFAAPTIPDGYRTIK